MTATVIAVADLEGLNTRCNKTDNYYLLLWFWLPLLLLMTVLATGTARAPAITSLLSVATIMFVAVTETKLKLS